MSDRTQSSSMPKWMNCSWNRESRSSNVDSRGDQVGTCTPKSTSYWHQVFEKSWTQTVKLLDSSKPQRWPSVPFVAAPRIQWGMLLSHTSEVYTGFHTTWTSMASMKIVRLEHLVLSALAKVIGAPLLPLVLSALASPVVRGSRKLIPYISNNVV
jgi:hypothetical protein